MLLQRTISVAKVADLTTPRRGQPPSEGAQQLPTFNPAARNRDVVSSSLPSVMEDLIEAPGHYIASPTMHRVKASPKSQRPSVHLAERDTTSAKSMTCIISVSL